MRKKNFYFINPSILLGKRAGLSILVTLILPFISLFLLANSGICGEIYSYVDSNGVWHFTNCPTSSAFTKLQISKEKIIIKDKGKSKEKKNIGSDLEIKKAIDQIARNIQIDPDLIKAIIMAESGGNPFAISPKGALGLMQLMPETANELSVSNPFDPEENIRGGTKYLSWLLKTYNGDLLSALAAYNAGPGTVKKFGGIPPYPETINYIKRVLKYWKQAKNP